MIFNYDTDLVKKISLLKIYFEIFSTLDLDFTLSNNYELLSQIHEKITLYNKSLTLDNINILHKKKFFKEILRHYQNP